MHVCACLPYKFIYIFTSTHKHISTSFIYLCTVRIKSIDCGAHILESLLYGRKLFFLLFPTSVRMLFHHPFFMLLLLYLDTMFRWQKLHTHTRTYTQKDKSMWNRREYVVYKVELHVLVPVHLRDTIWHIIVLHVDGWLFEKYLVCSMHY